MLTFVGKSARTFHQMPEARYDVTAKGCSRPMFSPSWIFPVGLHPCVDCAIVFHFQEVGQIWTWTARQITHSHVVENVLQSCLRAEMNITLEFGQGGSRRRQKQNCGFHMFFLRNPPPIFCSILCGKCFPNRIKNGGGDVLSACAPEAVGNSLSFDMFLISCVFLGGVLCPWPIIAQNKAFCYHFHTFTLIFGQTSKLAQLAHVSRR